MGVAAGCGPTCCHGTESGVFAEDAANEDVFAANAGIITVESTEPQKSPVYTYIFVAFKGTESSTA